MQLCRPLGTTWPVSTQYGEILYDAEGKPYQHLAIDWACPEGTEVLAAHAGVMRYEHTDLGGRVARVTGAECYTRYCHLLAYRVVDGQEVNAGNVIALSGNTGTSTTGPHLHFEARWPDSEPFNPMEYMGGAMCKGSYQFQGPATEFGKRHVRESGVTMIKQIQPDYVDTSWFTGDVIGRLWWDGEPDKQLVWLGGQGAEQWWNMAKPRIDRCPNIKLWEGPNEVAIDTADKARLYNEFELRRITILHLNGLKAVSGITSTGCWEPWVYPHIFDVFRTTDYWESHEYGMHSMALTDTGHLLRYRRVIAQLKAAGVRVPPWIIGETGIDFAGNPITDGWKCWATPAGYAEQLIAYLKEVAKDKEVVLVTPFVWSAQGWPSFDMTEDVSSLYTAYIKSVPVDDILAWAESIVIPFNPEAALFKYIISQFWVPQSQEMAYTDGTPVMWGWHPNNTRTLCAWKEGRVVELITRNN